MKIKAGVNLHNRFDVVKNGEWVGYAENIILDRMYNRVCNFSTYFVNIHFGTGSGTPTPERTSLFSHLGTKTAVTEEVVKALPTSKWTRKVVLMPEEYVGQTITEVGVAYGSTASYLVTHAMIKDVEGNPLSIDKTDVDIIEIYATIFMTFLPEVNVFWKTAKSNSLINYLTGSTAPSSTFEMGIMSPDTEICRPYSRNLTVTRSTAEKWVKGKTRVPIGDANISHKTVAWLDIVNFDLDYFPQFSAYVLPSITLGIGDGVEDTFEVPFGLCNSVAVAVDGVAVDATYVPGYTDRDRYPLSACIHPDLYGPTFSSASAGGNSSPVTQAVNITPDKYGTYMWLPSSTAYNTNTLHVHQSDDGVTWQINTYSGQNLVFTLSKPYVKFSGNHAQNPYSFYILFRKLEPANVVVLDTPPGQDQVVSAVCTVNYIPKTPDYVLDVEITIQFGEGV